MNVDESDLIGKPLDDVPKREAGEKCNGRKSTDGAFRGYCQATAGRGTHHVNEGRCKHHGGAADNRGTKNPNYEHGGYSKYLADYLTDEEHERATAFFEDLEDTENVQDIGRAIATDCWIRYQRTGDTRFLRELRQVCDTFGLTPEEVLQVEYSGAIDHEHSHELNDRQRTHLDAITDGPAEIDVEAVDGTN